MKVLIADDEENIRNLMQRFLALDGIDSDKAENGLSAQRLLESESYDAVLVDLKMPGMDGLSLVKWMRGNGIKSPVIMISAHGEIPDAVEALKSGVSDYLVKPFNPEVAVKKLRALSETGIAEKEIESDRESTLLKGNSAEIERIRGIIGRVAPSQATVLITGESGTGKEVVAKEIHRLSNVSEGPFMALNVSAVPENLLESELFGYERGAFTGAEKRKPGLFELANGGTLFLDEIGDMPQTLQVKILRVMQEKKIIRLGGTEIIPLNTRIIAASNRDIEKMIEKGEFREDLFYRLNVVRIHVHPLRERPEDIPVLAGYLISRYNKSMGKNISGISPEAVEALKLHPFYGNVRELENIIERAVIFSVSGRIELSDLDFNCALHGVSESTGSEDGSSLRDIERVAIMRALTRWEGNRTRAAEELGISRRTLITKISEYRLDI